MTQTQWKPEVQAMWERLEGFQLNDNKAVFDFAARLAKENGWTHTYAARVIQEYKRFLLMAMHAGHPVTPSEAVDQAWHLHLVYTRSYWEGLCKGILGRPLHHEPTAGGISEGSKYREQYQRTLDTYRDLFQADAPADIWPSVAECFKPKKSRWVDASRHWLIPKPGWMKRLTPSVFKASAAAVVTLITLASCQSVVDALDMRGMAFLQFYATSFGIAFLVSFLLVKMARGPARRIDQPLTDPYQIAFVNGGGARVVEAALAALFGMKLIALDETSSRPKIKRNLAILAPGSLHQVEYRLLQAVPETGSVGMVELRRAMLTVQERIQEEVIAEHLIFTSSSLASLRWQAALPMLAVMLIGVSKAFVGASRGRPIGFLIALLVISCILLIIRIVKVRRRTPTGDKMAKQLQKTRLREVQRHADSHGMVNDPMQMAMLVALGGYAMLNTPAFGDVHSSMHSALYRPDNGFSSGSGGGCGTSGCSNDSGGGDSGSSGCGGGSSGCGGCGGGGGD